jgi:two-component system cell cycle response regulator
MALRVLLADESSTIKKVMQLALQDFSVEVKAVPIGLDVLPVAKSFKPDIVFADVLLTKRSGYEVCADLKGDPATASLPVVLMWSGFMDLDESKTGACRADRRLEKPFDAETLRNLVRELVEKTRTNPVSEYLSFPRLPDFEEPARAGASVAVRFTNSTAPLSESQIYAIPEEREDSYSLDEGGLDQPSGEEFSHVPLTASSEPQQQEQTPLILEDSEWSNQKLSPLKNEAPRASIPSQPAPSLPTSDSFSSKFTLRKEELSHARFEVSGDFEEISFDDLKPQRKRPSTSAQAGPQSRDITPEVMEKNLQGQAREVIESICWKILPEIAERVIREEIQKMLRESEK